MSEKILSFRDLRVYQLAFELQQAESQHWLNTAMACQYVSAMEQTAMFAKCSRIGQMLGAIMADPEKWRPKS